MGGEPSKKTGKVLMPIGDATEAIDTLDPFFRLAESGYDVVVAGPEARRYPMVQHELPPNRDVPLVSHFHREAKPGPSSICRVTVAQTANRAFGGAAADAVKALDRSYQGS